MSTALVLMGGGARTAYQAGVLLGMAQVLRGNKLETGPAGFPFPILVGSSAGALNAAFLAARASQGLRAMEDLAQFWRKVHSADVYRVSESPWVKVSGWLAALSLGLHVRKTGALLDNTPLLNTLQKSISLPDIKAALARGDLHTLAVTASSYTSGQHWTFCQDANSPQQGQAMSALSRPGRCAATQVLGFEHLLASSALPLIFQAVPLFVDRHIEFFGDGSMRQVAPLSPAIHMGASRILLVGANEPQQSRRRKQPAHFTDSPSVGDVGAHLLSTIFFDAAEADVDLCHRINRSLARLSEDGPDDAKLPYRPIEVMGISPSESLDEIAKGFVETLPTATRRALSGVGALRGQGIGLASYLMFEPGFAQTLIDLGCKDALSQSEALLAFMAGRGDIQPK
jgi:NTE family protein